jgi:hypothetical protein
MSHVCVPFLKMLGLKGRKSVLYLRLSLPFKLKTLALTVFQTTKQLKSECIIVKRGALQNLAYSAEIFAEKKDETDGSELNQFFKVRVMMITAIRSRSLRYKNVTL